MRNIIPITPIDLDNDNVNAIPDEMIHAVNLLIKKHWDGSEAVVFKEVLVKKYLSFLSNFNIEVEEDNIYKYQWLNIEPIFNEAGWIVTYEQPCRDESFKEFYHFKRK